MYAIRAELCREYNGEFEIEFIVSINNTTLSSKESDFIIYRALVSVDVLPIAESVDIFSEYMYPGDSDFSNDGEIFNTLSEVIEKHIASARYVALNMKISITNDMLDESMLPILEKIQKAIHELL